MKNRNISHASPSSKVLNPKLKYERFEIEDTKIKVKQVAFQQSSFYFKSNLKDILRHKCHFIISTLSIFIVVLMALVIYSVIDKAPVIFLRLAEKNSGEIDGILTPPLTPINKVSPASNYKVAAQFNYTQFREIMPEINFAPRHYFSGYANKSKIDEINDEWIKIMYIDTERESKINLGKDYKYGKLKKDE